MRDDEIDYSDIPDLGDDETFWAQTQVAVPLTIWLEPEVLAWFKAQGKDFEAGIREALRAYRDAHAK
jgi:uncharacterized protein (DUF4415 family)